MITCSLVQCWRAQGCHLEEDGFTELCPKVKEIVQEAKDKTEASWESLYGSDLNHQVCSRKVLNPHGKPGHRFKFTYINSASTGVTIHKHMGTRRLIADSFSLGTAVERMARLRAAKHKKVSDKYILARKYELTLVDPGPLPEPWLPVNENNEFYEGATHIEDRCVFRPAGDPITAVDKLRKSRPIITRKQKEFWNDVLAHEKLQINQDKREQRIEQIMNEMEV